MSSPRLILCERSPRWLAAWRRALPMKRWNWLATAVSLAQVETRLAEFPGSVVAVSVTAENLATTVAKLLEWRRRFPQARFLAMLSPELLATATAGALLQEAGVLLVIERPEQLPAAARLVQRHLRRHVAEQLPWREAIWQRLPWQHIATAANSTPSSTQVPSSPQD